MILRDQCCTMAQGKILVELGIEVAALFYHVDNAFLGYEGVKIREKLNQKAKWGIPENGGIIKYYPAFTVAELGEMLPSCYTTMKLTHGWKGYDRDENDALGEEMYFKTEVECRAEILIYIIKKDVGHKYRVNAEMNL